MLTGEVPTATVNQILKLALEKNGAIKQDFTWDECKRLTGVGYSRAWLIVRRRHLELTAPELLVPTRDLIEQARAAAQAAGKEVEFATVKKGEQYSEGELHVMGLIARKLRLDHAGISWGEISVRMDVPESLVRKVFCHNSTLKDRGLRIGKGGRWAYDDPTLYTEHRQAEGAAIPSDVIGRPTIEQLYNGEKRLNRTPFLSETVKARRNGSKPARGKSLPQPQEA